MRLLVWILLLSSMGCDESFISDSPPTIGIGVDQDSDVSEPCFEVAQTRVDVVGDEVSQLVIQQRCWAGEAIEQLVIVDDPRGSFELDYGGLTRFTGVEDLIVFVSLAATEPGTYEAQVLVGQEGSETSIQLYGQR